MKITIETLAEFISEIEKEADRIHEKTVRIRQIKDRVNEVVLECGYVATAVVSDGGGGGYLLRYEESCGRDVESQLTGTEKTTDAVDFITDKCDGLGLHVRPGEIEL